MLHIKRPKEIVILTGSGISAESGIQTFRGTDGLWEGHDITDVATPQAFERDPELVYRFYNERRAQLLAEHINANPAHFALAKLQAEFPGTVNIITQNIDNLHERGGARNVIHMHGELLKTRCIKTRKILSCHSDIHLNSRCECCSEGSQIRPHIVWFGERPLFMEHIFDLLSKADLFVSIGTSGLVYPAAMFVDNVPAGPLCQKIEVNLTSTPKSPQFDFHLGGEASIQVPYLVELILKS